MRGIFYYMRRSYHNLKREKERERCKVTPLWALKIEERTMSQAVRAMAL